MTRAAVVFDWDDVVFNTAEFKSRVTDLLAREGLPRHKVRAAFDVAKDAHGYNPAIHAQMLAVAGGRRGRSAAWIAKRIWAACREFADKLLFQDALRTIRAIHRAGAPLYVLSAGRRRFQTTRIFGSGLVHLFEEVHIVDVTSPDAAVATKARILARLSKRHRNLIFLDDRPKTIAGIQGVAELRGKVLPVLVWRNEAEPPVPQGTAIVRRLSWRELREIAIHNGFGPY